MKRIASWVPFLLVFLALSCSSSQDAGPTSPDIPPNIVLILADDMGIGDLGAYNPETRTSTPNLDRMAAQGLRFTDVHSPSAVCTPTRYGLLTGRYAWRTSLKSGVLWGYSPCLIEQRRSTLASMLKRAGYNTSGIGKWHLGLGVNEETDYSQPLEPGPGAFGFDYYYGIPASLDMDPYLYFENDRVVEFPSEEIAGSGHRREGGSGFWRGGSIAPGFRHQEVLQTITDRAVARLREMSLEREPFFLYFALTAPHTPWLPLEKFQGRSGAGYYGDFCVQVDDCVGQVLQAVDEYAGGEDTLVIFTSDNGAHWPVSDIEEYDHHANLGYRGQKADIFEGGHRVPFLTWWPKKIEPGESCGEMICLTDLYATLASLVGQRLGEDEAEDSFNFFPLLEGELFETPIRESIVHHSLQGLFSLRKGHWKLVDGLGSGGFTQPVIVHPEPGGPQGQLYNLEEDSSETNNLWIKHPEIVEELRGLLEDVKNRGRSRPPGGSADRKM